MNKQLLLSATSSDDSPTSGFQINEIVKATHVDYEACHQIQNLLLERLGKKKHYNVKHKCLLLIKHICRNGRPEFKRDLQRRTDVIREHLQFKGPPDPLRGDQIYQRVRDAAREALDSIFDSHVPGSSNVSTVNRIVGMGSDYNEAGTEISTSQSRFKGPSAWFSNAQKSPEASYTNYSFSSESTMTGFGNTNFTPHTEQKSFLSSASHAVRGLARKASGKKSNSDQYKDFQSAGGYDPNELTKSQFSTAGSTWNPQNASFSAPPNPSPLQPNIFAGSIVPKFGRAGGADVGGEYERNQIAELCLPGGTKAVPPADKLRDFLRAVQTLDAEMIGSLLLEQLNRPEWQSTCKALCVIEAITKQPGCDALREYFHDWAEDMILPLCNAQKASVRDKAAKAIRALGLNAPSQTYSQSRNHISHIPVDCPSQSSGPQSSQAEVNLLGSFEATPAPPSALPETVKTQGQEEPVSTGGLFAGIQTKPPVSENPSNHVPGSAVNDNVSPVVQSSLFTGVSVKVPSNLPLNLPPQPTQHQHPPSIPQVVPLQTTQQPVSEQLPVAQSNPLNSASLADASPDATPFPSPLNVFPASHHKESSTLLDDLSATTSQPPQVSEPEKSSQHATIPTLSAEPNISSFDPLLNASMNVQPSAAQNTVPINNANNAMSVQMQQLQYQNMLLQRQMMQMSLGNQPMLQPQPIQQQQMMPGTNFVGHNPMQYNVRTSIALNEAAGRSGFNFLGGDQKGNTKDDSFSFVKDAMKNSKQ